MLIENEVSIKSESTPTGSGFKQEGKSYNIPATSGTHETIIDFPASVNIIRGMSFDLPSLVGDIVNMTIGKDDPVGLLIVSATAGDKTFSVTYTVTDNLDVGYNIHINGQDLGIIVDFTEDDENSIYTITTEHAISADVAAGSLIGYSYYMVKNMQYFGTSQEFRIEGSTMHSFLPKGQKIYVTIETTKSEARVLPIVFEYLLGKKID